MSNYPEISISEPYVIKNGTEKPCIWTSFLCGDCKISSKIDCKAVVRCTPKLDAGLEMTARQRSLTVHNSVANGEKYLVTIITTAGFFHISKTKIILLDSIHLFSDFPYIFV